MNNKLEYLLTNVFINIKSDIGNQLNNIIKNKQVYNIPYKKRRIVKNKLEIQFCKGNQLKKNNNHINIEPICNTNNNTHNNTNNSIINNDCIKTDYVKNCNHQNINNSPITQETKSYFNNTEHKIIVKINKPLKDNYPEKCSCIFLNKLVTNNQYLNILVQKKTGDYLSNILFSSLSQLYYNLSESDQRDELKTIKLKIITKFNKDNYYRNYDYSTKHFKKIDADDVFCNNKEITVNMLKIYGDVLNINVVYITNNDCYYITKFNKDIATVIISDSKNYIYTIGHIKSNRFLRGDMCIKTLDINKKYSKSTLEKFKLEELQNIAKMYNLDIKKEGKSRRINIKKEELIEIIAVN